ncbi:MAG: spore germination protein [Clostridia bacterium]|nr:spore germination protein [Clostridia bacterium]
MKNPFIFHEPEENNKFVLTSSKKEWKPEEKFKISRNLDENEEYIKKKFSLPENNDIIIRKIMLKGNRKGFAVFIDGMVSTDYVNSHIIETLLFIPLITDEDIKIKKEEIIDRFIAHSQAQAVEDPETVLEEINFGGCAVFIDGIDIAFSMDVRNWGHRSIDKPENEQTIYGPQEAYNEMLRNNSALVRKILKTEKLVCEGVKIGNVSKTRGVMMYIKDVTNENLVNEVRRRLEGINVDYIFAIEEVGTLVQDTKFSITNHILATERPDRTARYLADGRVALLLNGSPNALIFPTNAFELTHAASDAYMSSFFANTARVIRLIAMLLSVLLPGTYLATTLFHQEMIPTYLIYSISASRENVPFPSIVELILMDFSFEMIREAGLRMPGTIGSTLGIVGGLILGQAAVSAKIVSPIMIIIIAITGIGSFATSNYTLGWTYRILRLAFIVLGSCLGFYGIGIGVFIYSVYLASLNSFGIKFLSPLPGNNIKKIKKSIFIEPLWDKQYRPDYLKPEDKVKEAKISRSWIFNKADKDD